MSDSALHKEALVLQRFHQAGCLTIEQLAAELTELTWSELFHTIDSLSRNGVIVIRRKGFTYEIHQHLPQTVSTQ
jgi:DNA-binding MarR family transcriptional regulator